MVKNRTFWSCCLLCFICCFSFKYRDGDYRNKYSNAYRTISSIRGDGDREGIYDVSKYEGIGNKTSSRGYIGIPVFQGGSYNNRNISETTTSTNIDGMYFGELVFHPGAQPNKISKYISYREATESKTAIANGIDNKPTPLQLISMQNLGVNLFDKIREHFKVPIFISSFFRSTQLNKRVGGAVYSDHMASNGSAGLDIDMDGRYGPTNNELFFYVKNNLRFYKLIAEFPKNGKPQWVHISYSETELNNNEKNVFIAVSSGGRTRYLPYKGNEHLIR